MANIYDNLEKKTMWTIDDWKDISTAFQTWVMAKEMIDKEADQLADRGAKLRNKVMAKTEWEGHSNKTWTMLEETDMICQMAHEMKA